MKIVVAMSGGVDSSVAAALLAEQGHEVVGLSMQLYDQSEGQATFGSCCSLDDLHDARRVAHAIGIPHYILNFEREFHEQVVSNFVQEYAAGRTPIPCARCNSDLKFATLAERAAGFGADAIATGHYARLDRDPRTGQVRLLRGVDRAKDQAYFLFSLTQEQLAQARFPVGDVSKEIVREYARRFNLPVADKPDSQEICFVPDDDYAAFVGRQAPGVVAHGTIVDQQGRALGTHDGIHRFTVGQRKGLGVSGAAPVYVTDVRPDDDRVVVGPREALLRRFVTTAPLHWVDLDAAEGARRATFRVEVRIRHAAPPVPARLEVAPDGGGLVTFDAPVFAPAPGQALVAYDGEAVLAGAPIVSSAATAPASA